MDTRACPQTLARGHKHSYTPEALSEPGVGLPEGSRGLGRSEESTDCPIIKVSINFFASSAVLAPECETFVGVPITLAWEMSRIW